MTKEWSVYPLFGTIPDIKDTPLVSFSASLIERVKIEKVG